MNKIRALVFLDFYKNFLVSIPSFGFWLFSLASPAIALIFTMFLFASFFLVVVDSSKDGGNINSFVKTMPFKDYEIVISRYLYKLLVSIIVAIMLGVTIKFNRTTVLNLNIPYELALYILGFYLTLSAISTPLNYYFKNIKLELSLYYMGLFGIFIYFYLNLFTIQFDIGIYLALAGTILFLISIPISIIIFKKKD